MSNNFLDKLAGMIQENNAIPKDLYHSYDVKRGLRNADGSGVLAGLTRISSVVGSKMVDGKLQPVEGQLRYRGIDIRDIVDGLQAENRHGFGETAYLLLFGNLPRQSELAEFEDYLKSRMPLSKRLVASNILQFTSSSVMNALQKMVLTLYSVDENPDDITIPNVIRQCLELVAKFPAIIAYSFRAMRNKYHDESLFINPPNPEYDIAENFLHMVRPASEFTALEAELLDLALVLHAEHGGGNNSTFTAHVVSSSHTDTYSAIAAAVGSLKGPLHGAANSNVMYMMNNIKENVRDWTDREAVSNYVGKIIRKQAHNKTGLVYGLGHAVYTRSDPRALILKEKARQLAAQKGRTDEFQLYAIVEEVTPELFRRIKKSDKVISPNVDYFSGLVYDMLGFPLDIFTPLFAMARIVGWSAHRIDELINGGRIIRPGYKSVAEPQEYTPLSER